MANDVQLRQCLDAQVSASAVLVEHITLKKHPLDLPPLAQIAVR